MRDTRHEKYKTCDELEHVRLTTPEVSEGIRAKEHVEFEAAREHAKNQTCEVLEHVRHLRQESTFSTRHVGHEI